MRFNTVKQGHDIVGHVRMTAAEAKFFKSRFLKLEGDIETGIKIMVATSPTDYDVTLGKVPNSTLSALRIPRRYFSNSPNKLTKAIEINAKFANDVMTLSPVDISNMADRKARVISQRSSAAKKHNSGLKIDDPITILAKGLHDLNQLARQLNAKLWVGTDGRVKARVSKVITID